MGEVGVRFVDGWVGEVDGWVGEVGERGRFVGSEELCGRVG